MYYTYRIAKNNDYKYIISYNLYIIDNLFPSQYLFNMLFIINNLEINTFYEQIILVYHDEIL